MGDYGFWRKSDVQNNKNPNFSAIFESCQIQLHHISEWAKSDTNSLMWSILRSERSFEIFKIFEKSIMAKSAMPRFRDHMKMSRKMKNFFFLQKNTLRRPKPQNLNRIAHRQRAWKKIKKFDQKKPKNVRWARFWISHLYYSGTCADTIFTCFFAF